MSPEAHGEVNWVGITLFGPRESPGEITLAFVLLVLSELFAMERAVYHVLLCSIVDVKGSIKLLLFISIPLNRNVGGEVQDAFFCPLSLQSNYFIAQTNKWPFKRQPVIYPRLKAHLSPVGLQQSHESRCGFCSSALQCQETCLGTLQTPAFWRLNL